MTGDGYRRPSPPAVTIAGLGAFLLAARLIGLGTDDGSPASHRLVGGVEWNAWVLLAAASAVVFMLLLSWGLAGVVRSRPGWGLDDVPDRQRWGYLAAAAGLVAVLLVALVLLPAPARVATDLPVRHLVWRTRGLQVAGYLAAVPWLTLVWLAHARCTRLAARIAALPPGPAEEHEWCLGALQRVWRLMTACVTAAALSVIIAIVTAGALRAAFLASAPDRPDDFPASEVLLFGALFAALQAAIGLPLVITWRARARELVDRTYPLRLVAAPDDPDPAGRARLESLLHLDVTLLRNPLAALSVFAPLATSVLAAIVPGLLT